jgi:hypothetical protein
MNQIIVEIETAKAVVELPSPEHQGCSPARLPRSGLHGETPLPPLDGDVIDGDTVLSQQFPDIPLGQAVPQVPADCDRDHLTREPETSEDRGRTGRAHRGQYPACREWPGNSAS